MPVNEAIERVGEIALTPAFHDCDPMNVVWHGNYFVLRDRALRAARRYDYDYPQMLESGYLWPVVDARVYVRPLLFNQALRVVARIVEWENRLKIEYEIDAQSGQVLTRAMTIQVAVDAASKEMLYQCPPVLWERLGVPAP